MYHDVRQGTAVVLRITGSLTIGSHHASDDARPVLPLLPLAAKKNPYAHVVKTYFPQIWLSIGRCQVPADPYPLVEIKLGVGADL